MCARATALFLSSPLTMAAKNKNYKSKKKSSKVSKTGLNRPILSKPYLKRKKFKTQQNVYKPSLFLPLKQKKRKRQCSEFKNHQIKGQRKSIHQYHWQKKPTEVMRYTQKHLLACWVRNYLIHTQAIYKFIMTKNIIIKSLQVRTIIITFKNSSEPIFFNIIYVLNYNSNLIFLRYFSVTDILYYNYFECMILKQKEKQIRLVIIRKNFFSY